MTKYRAIKHTVVPIGYSGNNFNLWQRYIQRQLDKIRNTNASNKFLIN
jgi:hypothetical protein